MCHRPPAQLPRRRQDSNPADELIEIPNRGGGVATVRRNAGGTQCGQGRVQRGKQELTLGGGECPAETRSSTLVCKLETCPWGVTANVAA